jgi:hypothetical protein
MNHPTTSWTPEQARALEFAWGEYRVWAATSRQKKAEISTWRFRVLVATVSGALLGTVSSQISGLQADVSWVFGIAAGALIAIATYLGQEILKPDQERLWIRARSLAEALKAETFLFRTGASPYDIPEPASRMLLQVQDLLGQVRDLPAVNLSQEERRERLPEGPLSVEEYIEERVNDQVENFYRPRAQQYYELMKRWRMITLLIGGLAVILGALGKSTAAWVAVLTTIGTSVAAYIFANRYQYLIISYQATARQLELLKNQWIVMGAPEHYPEERNNFILNCEEAISIENSAWMAKLTEKPKS